MCFPLSLLHCSKAYSTSAISVNVRRQNRIAILPIRICATPDLDASIDDELGKHAVHNISYSSRLFDKPKLIGIDVDVVHLERT